MYTNIDSEFPRYGIPLNIEKYKRWDGMSEIDITDMNILCRVECTVSRRKPIKMALYYI